jgi:2-polyprenyl-6-methoxyphenol hydroxylase-like FAD-dependent oxidoreductase
MSDQQPSDVDVVVVGGGPVGVTMALLLARQGFTVTVFERSPEVYDLPRAIVMDDEIQRVFHDAGLGSELDAITTPLLGAEFVRLVF